MSLNAFCLFHCRSCPGVMSAPKNKGQHFYENPSNCSMYHDNATPHTDMKTSVTLDLLGIEKLIVPLPLEPRLCSVGFCAFSASQSQVWGPLFNSITNWSGHVMRFFNLIISGLVCRCLPKVGESASALFKAPGSLFWEGMTTARRLS